MIGTKITAAIARRDGTTCYPGKSYRGECFKILKSIVSPSSGLLHVMFLLDSVTYALGWKQISHVQVFFGSG